MLDPKANRSSRTPGTPERSPWPVKRQLPPSPLVKSSVQSYARTQEEQNNSCLSQANHGVTHRYICYLYVGVVFLFLFCFTGPLLESMGKGRQLESCFWVGLWIYLPICLKYRSQHFSFSIQVSLGRWHRNGCFYFWIFLFLVILFFPNQDYYNLFV